MSLSTHVRFTGRLLLKRHCVQAIPLRHFSQSQRPCWPKKQSQDRESIDTESTEYSKSDTDDSAAHSKVAFDPTTRSPEEEKSQASKEENVSQHSTDPCQTKYCADKKSLQGSGSPLDVSPANQDISKPKTESAGPGRPPDKTRRSGTQKLDENKKGSSGGSGQTS